MDLSTGENKTNTEALVAHQPGWFLAIIGILISLFVGFLFRAYFSPGFVKEKVLQASLNINNQVITHIDSARIKLKDRSLGVLPRFSIVLEQVTMESNQSCWMMPLLQIDEVTLPISLSSFLLRGKIEIQEMQARYVTLKLRSEKKCLQEASFSKQELQEESPAVIADKKSREMSGLKQFSAENFKIIYLPNRQNDLEFSQFRLNVVSEAPRKARLQADWNAFGDQRVGDYLFKSKLDFIFDEASDSIFSGDIKGQWREGSVDVRVKHSRTNERTLLSWNMKQVPMQQVMNMLNQYKFTQQKLNFKNFWFSTDGESEVINGKLNSFKFNKFILDGDLGNVQSGPVRGFSVDPLRFNEFDFIAKNINLDLALEAFKQDSRFILSLGKMNGSANVKDRKNLKLSGEWQDLKFIFSNKGKREVQTIKSIDILCELSDNIWNINLGEFVLNSNDPAQGSIKIKSDRQFENLNLKMNLSKIQLDPIVVNLMSNAGEISPFQVEVALQLKNKKVATFTSQLIFPSLKMENIKLENVIFDLKNEGDEVRFNVKSDRAETPIDNPAIQISKPLLSQMNMTEDLDLKNIRGEFIYSNNSLEWKRLKMDGRKSRLLLDGSWNSQGTLQGTIQSSGLIRKLWKLEGNRDEPKLIQIH